MGKKYSPTEYYKLREFQNKFSNDYEFNSIDEQRKLLISVGVKRILRGSKYFSINSNQLISQDIAKAFSQFSNELFAYLTKYRESFENDERSGLISELNLGQQGTLDFIGSEKIGEPYQERRPWGNPRDHFARQNRNKK